jgi:hypothetical protein
MLELIVENGLMENINANSYISLDFADMYLGLRGYNDWPAAIDPPEDDPNVDNKIIAIVRATDYLNGLNWTGHRYYPDNIMAWPRLNATNYHGTALAVNKIPEAVKAANAYLACLIYKGTDPQPILERGGRIASESVGSISTSYFDNASNRDVYCVLADLLYEICYDFRGYNGTSVNGKGSTKIVDIINA